VTSIEKRGEIMEGEEEENRGGGGGGGEGRGRTINTNLCILAPSLNIILLYLHITIS
jgi:hypothetical protein